MGIPKPVCVRVRPWSHTALFVIVTVAGTLINVPRPSAGQDQTPVAPQVGRGEVQPARALEQAELARLIEQMGDLDYQVRQRATDQLMHAGLEAQVPLQEALKHADAEVRRRARLALNRLLAIDYEARLARFHADTAGRDDHDLEGWARFRETVGSSPAARELFYQMHKAESGLLITGALGGSLASQTLEMRVQQLQQVLRDRDPKRRGSISPETVCSVLFVASDQTLEFNDANLVQIFPLLNSQQFLNELRNGKQKEVTRAVLGTWVARPAPAAVTYGNLRLAMQFQLKPALGPAVMMLVDKKQNAVHRQHGVLMVGMVGDRTHLQVLESQLTDETVCTRQSVTIDKKRIIVTTELRDVVLAVLIHLTGQDHKQYGFSRISKNAQTLFTTNTLGFDDAEQRKKALERWADWRKNHPVTEKQLALPTQKLPGGPVGVNPLSIRVPDEDERIANFFLSNRGAALQVMQIEPLVRDRQFALVVRLLDELLSSDADRSFEPHPGVSLHQSLRFTAARYLRQLPPAGIEAYRLFFEPHAQRQLDLALESGQWEALQSVGERFFHTRPGSEAWLLWCDEQLRQGKWIQAALGYQRLRDDSPWKSEYEPELSLKLAHCWLQSASRQDLRRAIDNWRTPTPVRVQLAGEVLQLPNEPAVAAWMNEHLAGAAQPASSAAADDWALDGHNPAHNPVVDSGAPWLEPRWEVSNFSGSELSASGDLSPAKYQQQMLKVHGQLQLAYQRQGIPALPASKPLVLGDRVVTRTTSALVAFDATSGTMLWKSTFRDSLDSLFADAGIHSFADSDNVVQAIEDRLYRDRTFSEMSSDGQRVYGLEDLGVSAGLTSTRLVVMPDGRRRLDSGWPTDFNRLTAYDVQTGKLCWEMGGPPIDQTLDQAGTYFLGAPLPLAGRLYCIAEVEEEIRLLVLDAEDGTLLQSQLLTMASNDRLLQGYQRQYGILARMPRRLAGITPGYANGMLICPVGLDSIMTLDMETLVPRWAFGDPAMDGNQGQAVLLNRFFGGLQRNVYERGKSWAECEVVAAENRVLFGTDSGELLCFDLESGDLLWRRPRGDSLYIAAVLNHAQGIGGIEPATAYVVLAGPSEILGVSLASGETVWQTSWDGGGTVSGRGYRHDAVCFFPLSNGEVLGVNAVTGEIAQRSLGVRNGVPFGNLVASAAGIFAQNTARLAAFGSLPDALQVARTEVNAAGNKVTVAQHARLGQLLLNQGEVWEALNHLRTAHQQQPSEAVTADLRQAVLAGFAQDDQRVAELATEYGSWFKSPEQQRQLQWALASFARRSGDHELAFSRLLNLGQNLPGKIAADDEAMIAAGDNWIHPSQARDVRTP